MWGGQFGIAADSPHVDATVRRALEHSSVALRGLHFHRGLTIRDEATMQSFVADVLAFCDNVQAWTGWHPAVLDLGGTWPARRWCRSRRASSGSTGRWAPIC